MKCTYRKNSKKHDEDSFEKRSKKVVQSTRSTFEHQMTQQQVIDFFDYIILCHRLMTFIHLLMWFIHSSFSFIHSSSPYIFIHSFNTYIYTLVLIEMNEWISKWINENYTHKFPSFLLWKKVIKTKLMLNYHERSKVKSKPYNL